MRNLLVIICFVMCFTVHAQSYIRPRYLQVTDNKTTNIIFPAAINSIDRGSERIAVQKSTGNILRVKADTSFSDTTNLTVITSDGKLYSFLVSYAASPTFLNLDLSLADVVTKDTAMLAFSQRVLKADNRLHGVRFSTGKVLLTLQGVYSNGQQIACKMRMENSSSLVYETGSLKAMVTGGRSGKRRASQDKDVPVLLIDPETTLVRERQSIVLVVILSKAALSPTQSLLILVHEQAGERQLVLSIANRHILNATLLK